MFVTPFLIGLAGSLHCIGMCGPLAAATSGGRNLVYNMGRIFTYGLLGSIISFVGMGLNFAGVQQVVSITVGILILVVAVMNIHVIAPSFVVKFIIRVRSRFKLSPVVSGMVNGLLPCGMTFVALGYCITLEGPLEGSVAMISFGLGTLPAMLGLSFIIKPLIQRLPKIQTVLMIVAGILLIGRGVTIQHTETGHDIVVCGVNSK